MGIESSNDKREWIKNNRLHLSANVGTNQWPAPPPSSQSEGRFPWTRSVSFEQREPFPFSSNTDGSMLRKAGWEEAGWKKV